MKSIEEAFEEANSLENYKGHGLEVKATQLIGAKIIRNRRYLLYEDQDKKYWYKVEILVNREWLPEEVAIFGRRLRR